MRRGWVLVGLLVACTSAGTRTIVPSRVVLVSFDGLGADELAKHSDLPAFAKLEREGRFVERVTPVTPCVTSSAHVAILTGTPPSVNGIVANRFHEPGKPWTEIADGFSADIDAETLVEAAHRQGKRVGSIAFPTIDARNVRRSADFGLVYSDPLVRSRMIHLTRADFHGSYGAVMRASLAPGADIVAYDTTDDHVTDYDKFVIDTPAGQITPNPWFSISEKKADGLYGSWSKLLRATPTLDDVTIYWGAVSRTEGYPASFRQLADDQVGFWPGPPDERSAQDRIEGGDGIDPETFAEQNARFCRFFADATALAIGQMKFDLLLVYEPTVDKAEHQFFITLDTQAHATPENRAAGTRVRTRAFEDADRAVQRIASTLDPAHDTLVVTGDHGLAPIDTEVHLKRLLTDWGFDRDWIAIATGGGVAHLYGSTKTAELKAKLEETGFIERIDPKSHPNSGDLVLFAYPNIALSPFGGEPVTNPRGYGQHGGIGSHHEFQTVLIAWGAGIARATIPHMRQTEIAAYVSGLLGIKTPRALAESASAPRGSLPR
ncbi:MAG TPA: alkaline phosphatase family protein [Thermoanaerobaculia bacterium]|nr:alkaline phosphatase family protein [Thermoanaerobaculia bacterium]